MLAIFREQPKAFRLIFLLEFWERFGFYTVQGILILYFIRYLGFSETQAYQTFGAYSALIYGLIVIGGYLGDKVLGIKRTIALGLMVLTLGYACLAFSNPQYVFFSLGLICVGNGLFKANPSNLLSKCYEKNDPRLHSGFTLYYMAINLGSVFALFIGPAAASHYGYTYAYLISALGLLSGLVTYAFQYRLIASIKTSTDSARIFLWQWSLLIGGIFLLAWICSCLLQRVFFARNLLWAITGIVTCIYFYWMKKQETASFRNMLIAFILMVEAVIFFTLYQQMPTSINLFAVNNVIPDFLGMTIDPQSFQGLNPIWIIILSPLLAYGYSGLNNRGFSFTVPYKFALGMTMAGLSFLILFFARFFPSEHGMVSSGWLILSYLFQSFGELLVSAMGIAMVAELVPAEITGFVMGMWFLTSSLAGFLGATVASYTALPVNVKPGMESLMIYTKVFAWIGIIILIIALGMWVLAIFLNKYMTLKPIKKNDLK